MFTTFKKSERLEFDFLWDFYNWRCTQCSDLHQGTRKERDLVSR